MGDSCSRIARAQAGIPTLSLGLVSDGSRRLFKQVTDHKVFVLPWEIAQKNGTFPMVDTYFQQITRHTILSLQHIESLEQPHVLWVEPSLYAVQRREILVDMSLIHL